MSSPIRAVEFNNMVNTFISNSARSLVSWHRGNIPPNTINVNAYANISDFRQYNPISQNDSVLAHTAYESIKNTAEQHSSIRRVTTGRRVHVFGRHGSNWRDETVRVTRYAALTPNYRANISSILESIRNNPAMVKSNVLRIDDINNALSAFNSSFISTISAGVFDFTTCHSNCHDKCHSNRSRR